MRDLPSMTALLAFDAALRHLSFTRAGQELGRTQGAISRQIAQLEKELRTRLFIRDHAKLRPTPAARAFGAQLTGLLARLDGLTTEMRAAGQVGGTLHLAILPTFGTRWLIPRMPSFRAAHPEVSIHFTSAIGVFDFDTVGIDAAIHHGAPQWPGAVLEPLMQEEIIVVCTPAIAASLHQPADLLEQTLLRVESRLGAWDRWFREMGVPDAQWPDGPLFESHLMSIQAAVAGLGVAQLPSFLVQDELRRGELVEPFPDRTLAGDLGYYLAYPAWNRELPALKAFRAWIGDTLG
ncbi:MAG: LysR family transcriptional regulator [Planctomycetes bacterium]|nr:LysR family transcriptional regulator [Planctomycetota bacterium]